MLEKFQIKDDSKTEPDFPGLTSAETARALARRWLSSPAEMPEEGGSLLPRVTAFDYHAEAIGWVKPSITAEQRDEVAAPGFEEAVLRVVPPGCRITDVRTQEISQKEWSAKWTLYQANKPADWPEDDPNCPSEEHF